MGEPPLFLTFTVVFCIFKALYLRHPVLQMIFMKRIYKLIFIIAGVISLSTCNTNKSDTTPSTCGEEKRWDVDFPKEGPKPWQDPTWTSYTEGNNRVFQVSTPIIENVCSEMHIRNVFSSYFEQGSTRIIQFRLKYRYSIFGGEFLVSKQVTSGFESFVLPYDATFGIKQAYDNIPGSFWAYFEWVLSDYLDYSVDLAYFQSKFKDASGSIFYNVFARSSH